MLKLKNKFGSLRVNLQTTTIVAPPSNASKWQMGFNSAFKGLNVAAVGRVELRALVTQNCLYLWLFLQYIMDFA